MKQLLNHQIIAYNMGDGWRVDIVILADEYEAWIYEEDHGVKTLMFGLSQEQTRFRSFCDMVQDNFEEYKRIYTEEVIEGGSNA